LVKASYFESQDSSQHRVGWVAHRLLQKHVQDGLDQAQVPIELARHSLQKGTGISQIWTRTSTKKYEGQASRGKAIDSSAKSIKRKKVFRYRYI